MVVGIDSSTNRRRAKSDLVHKFIVQLTKLRKTHSSPFGAEDRTLGWHNFRANPSLYVFSTAVY